MKYFLTTIIILCFTTCKTVYKLNNIEGVYSKSGKDFIYTLNLHKDSSFHLSQKYYEVNSFCQGRWQLSADTILLLCADEDLVAKLQSGYLTQRKWKVIVMSKNKLKLGSVIMRKK